MKYVVTLCRILVGVLFIISGLIKSNDTIGFAYKLEEYYQVFGTEFLISSAVLQAGFICAFEVVLGVTLLLGTRVRLTIFLLTAMIVFFTFLTFYSAYFNKVTDCGCFGDALKLTPWESFTKDVVLLVLILVLLIGQKHIKPLFNARVTNIIVILAILANIAFPYYTYNYMPVIDFRPYAVGNDILKGMQGGRPPKFETKLLYKNLQTGKVEELDKPPYTDTINWEIDTLKWQFVDQKQTILDPGELPPIHDFSIANMEGYDYTEDILKYPGNQFFLVAYDIQKADRNVQPAINQFASAAEKAGIPFYGLTASIPSTVEEFRHEVQSPYAYYTTDGTQLKTMIRSNPGLILLNGAKVLGMWHHNAFPTFEEVNAAFTLKSGGPSPAQ